MTKIRPQLKIKNRIITLRTERKLTQEKLAESIGVTRATINALEGGDYNPSLELAFRLARYFEVDLEFLFEVEGQK